MGCYNEIYALHESKKHLVLYRWFNDHRKYMCLITCNIDCADMYILSDDDMVSHCYWKDNHEIISFERKKESCPGYYLMKDKTNIYGLSLTMTGIQAIVRQTTHLS